MGIAIFGLPFIPIFLKRSKKLDSHLFQKCGLMVLSLSIWIDLGWTSELAISEKVMSSIAYDVTKITDGMPNDTANG